jgi:hypothetical protein
MRSGTRKISVPPAEDFGYTAAVLEPVVAVTLEIQNSLTD